MGFPFGTQTGFQLRPNGSKKHKTWSQEYRKRQLENMSEKASEKAPILSARTCQNHGTVFQNHTFQVFSRGLKNDSQRPRFWKPSGLPNPNKPSPGGSPKKSKKLVPPNLFQGRKMLPTRRWFFLPFGSIFRGLLPRKPPDPSLGAF